ncbi:hypothetical protein HK405_010243, partial [Cladochytrium tenue]
MSTEMLRELRGKFVPAALPPAGSFRGQSVLVTGGTGGLGLASAAHYARLGAARVAITGRDETRCAAARRAVEEAAREAGNADVEVEVFALDLCSYSSCVAFVEEVKRRSTTRRRGGFDIVLMNAGVQMMTFEKSPEGWEITIQVNALSTLLLGLLLMAWMKEERKHRQSPAHMVFVSSGMHVYPDITKWNVWVEQGEPDVIVTSVCPGLVNTDLARHVKDQSLVFKLLVPVVFGMVAKSADYGARYFVNASLAHEESHGKFLRYYLTDEEYD